MTPTDLIRQLVAGFENADVRPLGEGMDSRAFEVGGAYVVKLPKHAAASAGLEREAAILPELAGSLPLAVPRVEPLGRFGPEGFLAVGYPKVAGVPLDRARYDAFTATERDACLGMLADFLDALHAFPADRASRLGLPAHDLADDLANLLRLTRASFRPWLETRDVDRIEALFGGFLADLTRPAAPPALLHADFSPDHILVDPATNRPCGVIDFGDASVGDPDFDFMYVDEDLGRDVVDAWLRLRPHPDPASLFRKLHVFEVQNALDDLEAGLDRGDAEVRDEAVSRLRARLGG